MLILQAPESFRANMEAMRELTKIYEDPADLEAIVFAVIFVTEQEEINRLAPGIAKKLKGDALVWFCYPKKSSKEYQCNFNRDTGWEIMGELGLEPVRQVAVDADWSALRFRKVEYIKNITRRESMALTKEAKKRTSNKD